MSISSKHSILYLFMVAVFLCSCGEDTATVPSDELDAITLISLVPDTIDRDGCLDVDVTFKNLSTDTLVLDLAGNYHVQYSVEVSDSGRIWFPENDAFVFTSLRLAPGDSIEKSVALCAFRGGNTHWYKIDSDTLASGSYNITAGITAVNLECCTRGKAIFHVR